MVKIYGIKFYHYKTSQKPFSNEYIYAVLKIKKYKKSYLCRGIYKNGRPVDFSTSVIAVALILWDAMRIEVKYITKYLIAVIVIGIVVGFGLLLAADHWPIIK